MRVTMNSGDLDITEWPGKKQHLQTLIESEVYQRHLNNTLPHNLIMTMEQYEMLKNTIEMGEKGDWRYFKPYDRIYKTKYNVMETTIKK